MIGRSESRPPSVQQTNSSISPVASLKCPEEVACRISTYFKTLLRSSQRKTRLLPIPTRSDARRNQDHLENVAWSYTRIVELWKSHMLNDGSLQFEVFQDNFEERLVQICLALAEYADAKRNFRGPFHPNDQTRKIALFETLVDSLEQAWLTWSLCVDIHKQANDRIL